MASGSIQVIWSSDDVAVVSISGDSATWTVNGSTVTFPHRITADTTFTASRPGRYVVSVQQNGQEIAGNPDATVTVELREGQVFAFAPSPGTIDTAIYRLDRDDLASGETTVSRRMTGAAGTLTTQTLRLAYKKATKTETIGSVILAGAGTAAGATMTLCKVGIYEEDPNTLDLTLVASSANSTSKFSSAVSGTESTFTLSSNFNKVRGRRYAVAVLVVTSATAPNILVGATMSGTSAIKNPRLCAAVAGQTDLPASIANSTLASAGTSVCPYAELVPA